MDLITRFFTTYYKSMEDFYFQFPPSRMQEESVQRSNFYSWILNPTNIKISDYDYIEERLEGYLPDIFKQWHSKHYALEQSIDIGIIFFPVPTLDKPFHQLEQYLFEYGDGYKDIRELGLIPFAYDANARGPLCFDTSGGIQNPNKYPIVLFEYDTWNKSDVAFTTFEKLLECSIDFIETGTTDNFSNIDPQASRVY